VCVCVGGERERERERERKKIKISENEYLDIIVGQCSAFVKYLSYISSSETRSRLLLMRNASCL